MDGEEGARALGGDGHGLEGMQVEEGPLFLSFIKWNMTRWL